MRVSSIIHRFDDIFDSTRYVKALEELKEQKKKYTAKVKDHKIELAELEGHKHASVGLRMDLDAVSRLRIRLCVDPFLLFHYFI